MEWLLIGTVGFLALALGAALCVGALALLPVTCGVAFVGWLIGGPAGALAGVGICGVLGLIMLQDRHPS